MAWNLLQGDVRDKLAEIPEKSVQTCITSPPYWGLRSYLPDKVKLRDDAPDWVVEELKKGGIKPCAKI